ncbi:TetR family transcriptional regulator [Gottfriedia luciferensis]|uniref:TetR family transcriptional regulator n=1 Tax=Gottfriedia luciferensis TaxID=178774 RepID=UPI000B44DFEE|nr:TetR family transcriptional regulator [Gottfriedia luciferensis]
MNDLIFDTLVFSKVESNFEKYEIIDADWKDEYGLIVLLKEKKKYILFFNDENFLSINLKVDFPIVRWVDGETIVIVDSREELKKDNVFILNIDGKIVDSFNCGDGVEDVEVGKEGIWISYFDEGVFGSGISTEGLVLFSLEGKIIFRYHSDLLKCPIIDDCYAISKGKGSSIWVFPYSEFPLLQLYPESREIKIYKVPVKFRGSHAISIRGKYAYFCGGYDSKGKLYCWEIGKEKYEMIGRIDGITRGLANGESNHFMSISDKFIRLHKIIKDDEFNFS